MALTPMMRQYLEIKEQHPGEILFFRLGDFYEMFFDDAKLASAELELTLTGKDCGLEQRAPMCGVPYHAVDAYVARLIRKGYKVAICEQMEDPAEAKGLVERGITRIITPGTVTEPGMLDEKRPNYILSVSIERDRAGCAFCDLSTGFFGFFQTEGADLSLTDEIAAIYPSEIITNDRDALALSDPEAAGRAGVEDGFAYADAAKCLTAHFGKKPAEMGMEKKRLAVSAAGALIAYLMRTQKIGLSHIAECTEYHSTRRMTLDRAAMRNLELTETVRGAARKGSLIWTLDRTRTSMGGRLLREWVERPLYDAQEITRRLDAVERMIARPMEREELGESLSGVYDMERLLSRIAFDSVNARDLLALRNSLERVPGIRQAADGFGAALTSECAQQLDELPDFSAELARAISDEPPVSVKDGGMIRQGFDPELDELRDIALNAKGYVADMEKRERESTGIRNLKIGYNRVFGYYIEVTKSFLDQVPFGYTRKQTLANCERFVTEELKTMETKILGAEESAIRLEYKLLCAIRQELASLMPRLRRDAAALKTLDALQSLAAAATANGYVRPGINTEGRLTIRDGRHPVVEESIGRDSFVPNDTTIDPEHRVMIITGPNMAGKSTYMRQVALIVLMAHIGSYVPASEADVPLTDRIFTRIGASDDLYGGQSTFMVEMTEMASILKHATDNSLVILDEVGRGTSTFDGLAIAWSAAEHLAGKNRARTLFATHYHELSELEGKVEGVVNYRITAKELGEDVVFLRKIVPGGADRSYGVAVAKLAGLPRSVLQRARQIMARLSVEDEAHGNIGQSILAGKKPDARQLGMEDYRPMELAQEIAGLDVVSMTPIDALNKLFELNEKAKRL